MNFTNSPFERMMRQVPPAPRPRPRKPPTGSVCRGCSYWKGAACVGTCARDLMRTATSGQLGSKLAAR